MAPAAPPSLPGRPLASSPTQPPDLRLWQPRQACWDVPPRARQPRPLACGSCGPVMPAGPSLRARQLRPLTYALATPSSLPDGPASSTNAALAQIRPVRSVRRGVELGELVRVCRRCCCAPLCGTPGVSIAHPPTRCVDLSGCGLQSQNRESSPGPKEGPTARAQRLRARNSSFPLGPGGLSAAWSTLPGGPLRPLSSEP